jgi:predicted phosphodiesterase
VRTIDEVFENFKNFTADNYNQYTVFFCHASPDNYEDAPRTDDLSTIDNLTMSRQTEYPIYISGHTHIPHIKRKNYLCMLSVFQTD